MSSAVAQAALTFLQAMSRKEGESGLKNIAIALVAVVTAVVLLLCGIVYVLTSPFEFDGELGAFQSMYSYPVAPADSATGGEALLPEELAALTQGITDPDRRAVVEAALSLVGRAPYFWGGKSGPGWNEEWNTLKLVTAPGSSTSTIRQSLNSTHDVVAILETYRKVCGPILRVEIERTLNDMVTGNPERALKAMEGRVASPQLGQLTRGLVSVPRGDDQRLYFDMLSAEYRKAQNEEVAKALLNRPAQLNKYMALLFVCMVLMIIASLGTYLAQQMGTFF